MIARILLLFSKQQRYFLIAVVAFYSSIFLLLGCAANNNVTQSSMGNASEPVTASDETDIRKRARIRLELAVGYYEKGQINVALDEVKQSLALDPAYADAHTLRGVVLMQMGEYRLAEESFRRTLQFQARDGNALHNLGWLQCQTGRITDAIASFSLALGNPAYGDKSKTLMTRGLCERRQGDLIAAEASFQRSYELDAANPIAGYQLGDLLLRRNELIRAQFILRRLNNSEYANAESLWLGMKIERRLGDDIALQQLGTQLKRRYPGAAETRAYERGAFNE
jgi:type IV pilus assembly protein PilF